MKACFLLQRRFAYVGHKLAKILKEKYGIEEFCGYVYLRSSFEFLKNQKEINYTSLLLDEDIHNKYKEESLDLAYLQQLEKEYGIPYLWPYLALDRMIMFDLPKREYPYNTPAYTHEEMMRIFQVKARAIIKFLEEEKPDFIFLSVIGTISSLLLYQIAKKKGVKVFLGLETRVGDNFTLTENYENFSYAEKLFTDLIKREIESKKINEARDYIKNFREKPISYIYTLKDGTKDTSRLKEFKWFLPKNFFKSFKWFLKLTFLYLSKKRWRYYTEGNPVSFFIDHTKRKIRGLIGYEHLYDTVNLKEDFAFFPLHYEPEVATMLWAPFWTNQPNLIRQIAKSLPLHFKLYIKENPAMLGYRTQAYYKELKKIPNVKIINPNFNSFELTKNSRLVITLTSTVGWEAVLFKKPVITFGDVFYNILSMVRHCHDIEQLPFIVKNQLENYRHNEKELENFIGAMMEESAPIAVLEIWEKGMDEKEEKKQLTRLADLIIKKTKN